MAPRSRTGCLTCRQRKLKCSEERPVCAQCIKANRECIPSSGITFRHQQNPSMNGGDQGEGGLKSFYGYKETFGKGVTWVPVPRDLTFVHTNNPYEDEDGEEIGGGGGGDSTLLSQHAFSDGGGGGGIDASDFRLSQDAYPAYATHGLEALSAVASQDQYSYAPPAPMGQHDPMSSHNMAVGPQSPSSPQHGQAGSSQNLDFILNPSSNLPPAEGNIDPRLHSHTAAQSPTHVRIQSFASVGGRASLRSKGLHHRATIEEPQLAFLLRDFSERAGLWMDLFDLGLFFATRVPVLAVTCPLLMYACAALSAKSLARVNGRKPVMGGQISPPRRAKMEYWPGAPPDIEDWVRKAREYYDVAVSLLRQALAGASRPPTSSLPDHATPETLFTAQRAPLPTTDSDELVAATAILCVYEFLDASGSEWSRHLDGAKSLFDIAKDRMVSLTLPQSPVSIAQHATWQLGPHPDPEQHVPQQQQLNSGRRAVFWNFARQDMLSAFINHTSTRLDTGDLPMWLSAGIRLTPDGRVCPSNPRHPQFSVHRAMGEDMIANALVWLILKLVNFIAAGDEVPGALSPMGLGIRQQELLEYWEGIEEQLFTWYEGLPDGFHATVTRVHDAAYNITEKWFPRPMCASAMQSYHFAQIQLLHNKPHLTTATPAPSQFGMSPSSSSSAAAAAAAAATMAPGTSLATRHASYSGILQRSRVHAKEIVAISLARSDEGTRINSVQPLWTAGLVLGNEPSPPDDDEGGVGDETRTWRRIIVDLLRGIEWDLGWASEYRVQSLLELWGLPPEWPATAVGQG